MFKRGYKAPYVRVVLKARAWRVPMKLLKWRRKMPSTKQYNLVPNDEYDTRIPLHPDEAFSYGITFQAKYIGTMDVPRPTSRVEIVAAMRRVRYEFKAKGVKKRKVTVDVSTDGVRVTTRTIIGKTKSQKLFGWSSKTVTEGVEIMNHPIYRIFYVSHDSSDLKIFSYIARDGATNVFKCNVFKSNRKSQAMRIVRTVGQAFEVCHKMQSTGDQAAASTSSAVEEATVDRASDVAASKEAASECGASESCAASTSKATAADNACATSSAAAGASASEAGKSAGSAGASTEPARPVHLELLPPPPRKDGKRSPQRTTPAPTITLPDLPECITKVDVCSVEGDAATPLSAQHQLQLLKERLEQQGQQTRAAVAQLLLLRDQLAAEQAARCEAQARTHQLLVHNKELLEHISALVAHLQERERGSSRPISAQQLSLLPQMKFERAPVAATCPSQPACNGNTAPLAHHTDSLINLITQTKVTQNVENNNVHLSPFNSSPLIPGTPTTGAPSPSFGNMTNEQIQNYLISKFQDMGGFPNGSNEPSAEKFNKNQQFYQNRNAFPSIPLLTNHYSNMDLTSLLSQHAYQHRGGSGDEAAAALPMSLSDTSPGSNSQATTSKDSSPDPSSSDEGAPFIMPLSHKGTLTATGKDGRVRLIVPVSPSGSLVEVPELQETTGTVGAVVATTGGLLTVTPAGPITRSTSEKVPNRSELMTAMRLQWTRHTTK